MRIFPSKNNKCGEDMTTYPVHEDYKRFNFGVPLHPFILPVLQIIVRIIFKIQGTPRGINHRKRIISSCLGHNIPLEIFSPEGIEHNAPCLLFLHGGAFVLPATGHHKKLICDYALNCSCKVIFVDYRLAPKHSYPQGLEDCYTAYKWIIDEAEENNIDINKIGICGDSAGGGLAAALTLLIRDRSLKMPLFQMLIYPALDSDLETESMKKYKDTPIWNAELNKKMWALYLSKSEETINLEYASPIKAESLKGLPEGYIEVNEFDCIRDEAIDYYKRLKQCGIETVLNQTVGTVHGFEFNYNSPYTQEIIRKRIDYIKKRFAG